MRAAARKAAVAVVVSCALVMMACSTEWIEEAEKIVATLVPAVSNILALVAAFEGKSVSPQDAQVIQNAGTQAGADLQLIQSLIGQYEAADAAGKAGILSKIQNAMATAEANLNAILPALHIKDAATEAKIQAVVGLCLAELESLEAIVPVAQPATQNVSRIGAAGGSQSFHAVGNSAAQVGQPAATRAPLSASEFAASYNKVMTAKTGNAELDRATVKLAIRRHSKFVRWASAGMVK
jgi:hypothetical protein